jgi:signal peptidase II
VSDANDRLPSMALPAPAAAPPRLTVRRFEVLAVALIVALDQITKEIVRRTIDLHDRVPVIDGLLDFTHVRNTGAAFGLFNTTSFEYKPLVMIAVACLALVAIAVYASQLALHERLARFGLALILGGAFGNLIDRATAGHVVDFVDVYWGDAHFWAFNVADAAISIGAVLVLLDMLGIGRPHVSDPV